jgi:5-methyltetrahydropteroyltriglutamate--homocysteine methyltransferase
MRSARAKRDATLLWLKEQEDAGIDIVSDGEQSRAALRARLPRVRRGDRLRAQGQDGNPQQPLRGDGPAVVGPLRLKGRVHQTEARMARAHTKKKLKITMPGR